MLLDFKRVKEKAPIELVAHWLNLEVSKSGDTLRGRCPICDADSDRCFTISPSRDLFRCFNTDCGLWGDQIELVAHVRGIGKKSAAKLLREKFDLNGVNTDDKLSKIADYLVHDHELLKKVGLNPATCKKLSCGYKPKGVLSGRLAIPITYEDGTLVGYVGRALKPKQTEIEFPHSFHVEGHLYGLHRPVEGDLYIAQDPLRALIGIQHGYSCVSFLGTVSTLAMRILCNWMDERDISTAKMLY